MLQISPCQVGSRRVAVCAVPYMTVVTKLHPVLTAIHDELCSISLDPRLVFPPAKLVLPWDDNSPTRHRHCPSFQLPMPTRPPKQARHQPIGHAFSGQRPDSLDFMRADEAGIRGEGVYGGRVPLRLLVISYGVVTRASRHEAIQTWTRFDIHGEVATGDYQ